VPPSNLTGVRGRVHDACALLLPRIQTEQHNNSEQWLFSYQGPIPLGRNSGIALHQKFPSSSSSDRCQVCGMSAKGAVQYLNLPCLPTSLTQCLQKAVTENWCLAVRSPTNVCQGVHQQHEHRCINPYTQAFPRELGSGGISTGGVVRALDEVLWHSVIHKWTYIGSTKGNKLQRARHHASAKALARGNALSTGLAAFAARNTPTMGDLIDHTQNRSTCLKGQALRKTLIAPALTLAHKKSGGMPISAPELRCNGREQSSWGNSAG
jgi:hypothetical protein